MARGADTMALSVTGWTPLAVAIYWSITSSRDENQSATASNLRQFARNILNAQNFKAEHIDAVNDEEGTALHYATTYAMPDLVLLLLKRGARMYNMQVGDIYQFQEEHLEAFLDTCIYYESQGKKVSECSLHFDYTFLNDSLDKEVDQEKKDKNSESNAARGGDVVVDVKSVDDVKRDEAMPEQAIFHFIPTPPPQKGGLTQKKDILEAEATLDGTNGGISDERKRKKATVRTETTILEDMTAQHRNLLKHPLPRAFLMLKWRKINNIYKTWIVMKALFLCLLVAIVARNFRHSHVEKETLERLQNNTGEMNGTAEASHLDTINYFLLVPLSFLLMIFLLVELLQFLISPHSWLLELKSWLQLTILTASAVLLLAFWRVSSTREEVVRQVAAYLLPLSYYEFLHELGCHPRFSKYILLFKRISVKFVKYTSIYIGMVIMCAFSFSVMITRDDWDNDKEEGGLVSMILGTILMFIGEVGIPQLSKEFFAAQVAPFNALFKEFRTSKTRSCSSLALFSSS